MSQIRKAVFGALAISLTSGALQLASGHDLIGSRQVTANAPQTGVNRAAKADRAAVSSLGGQSRTIALRLDGLADTSVLIRLPLTKGEAAKGEARNRPAPVTVTKPGDHRRTVACEPVVSVLTEVAKLLQPGRCVT